MEARALLAVILGLVVECAHPQVAIDPPSPRAFFEVRVKVKGSEFGLDLDGNRDFYQARNTTVTMSGNKITVSPLMTGGTDFSAQPPQPDMDQPVGALPPGTYQLEVVKRATGRGSTGQVGSTRTFTVLPREDSAPLANHTDLWWVPTESGWGVSLIHHPSLQIFGALLVYGTDSKPAWYTLQEGSFPEPTRFVGTLYRTTGPYFGGPFDPSSVTVAPAGSAVIVFNETNLDKAVIRFTIDGVEFVKNIEKLPF